VLISETPYFGEAKPPDRTEQICEEHGCEVIKGTWELDHMQRTLGNKMCMDCDWVLGFDSDEMMTAEHMEKLISFLKHDAQADAIGMQEIVYFKTTDWIIDPQSGYEPIIAMRPDVKFTYIRNIDRCFQVYKGDMHHVSWSAPKDIYKKVTNYAHATDFDGGKWYREYYDSYVPEQGKEIIFPAGQRHFCQYAPLPAELQNYL
jgi:hypothetical protein